MRILVSTPTFLPEVGGLEILTAHLAARFAALGHSVRLVTRTTTPDPRDASFPYEIVRRPSPWRMLALAWWAEVHLQSQLNLTFGWPHLVLRRPLIMAHQNWTPRVGVRGYLKHWLMRLGPNIACSSAIAGSLPIRAAVIGNPYADEVFPLVPFGGQREKDILFVGRLVEDKGAADLVSALQILREQGFSFTASFIGGGGERARLERQVADAGLSEAVDFLGERSPTEASRAMQNHRILVVPSRWEEPFGIVALEGIASGCIVLVTEAGGLPDAGGACAVKVPKADPAALAAHLATALCSSVATVDDETRRTHLQRHTVAAVANKYLEVMSRGIRAADRSSGIN
ncbi:glycosyltransferase family 4 protein [Micromonospora sp. STR1s_5]|nr:glycosyltransferase family 4 protein [Micromonospora sp. STR1s_5]